MLPAFLSPELGLIFWQLVIFLLVLWLLAKFAWGPILRSLKERKTALRTPLRLADQAKLEMQQLKAGNEKLLAAARQERDRTLKEAQTMANQLIETAKTKATEEGGRLITQAARPSKREERCLAEVRNTAASSA